MTVASAHSVERTVHKTNEWLKDLGAELGIDDREVEWRILRGYLHVLRDRLTLDEGAQLAAQLPQLIRGAFYEGFDPGRQPEKYRDAETFLVQLGEFAQVDDAEEAALAAIACTAVLQRQITGGELDDVLSQLPKPIRELLEPPGR